MTRDGRLATVLIMTLGLGWATAASAQPESTPRTLAERLSSLRLGWGQNRDSEEQDASATPPRRVASAANPQAPPLPSPAGAPRSRATSQDSRDRLPSLNPRDLLPRDLLPRRSSPAATSPPRRGATSRSGPGVGSARARIMRDLRSRAVENANSTEQSEQPAVNNPAAPEAPFVRRAPARAGSALSASAPTATQPSPERQRRAAVESEALRRELVSAPAARAPQGNPRTSRELTKSIAAEIAREMAADTTVSSRNTAEASKPAADREPTPPHARPPAGEPLASTADEQKLDRSPEEDIPTTTQDVASTPDGTTATQDAIPLIESRFAVSESDASRGVGSAAEEDLAPFNSPAPVTNTEQTLVEPVRVKPTADTPVVRFGDITVERIRGHAAGNSAGRPERRTPVVDATAAPLAASEVEVLMSDKMPLITSRVEGPRRIVIGRKANYTVTLANRGAAAADKLVARVKAPAWADVLATEATRGSVRRQGDDGLLEWRLNRFEAQGAAELNLTIVARQGRPIELGVDWAHAPIGGKTIVEVQEPKLELSVTGPDEVLFGEPRRYRLKLTNPGTGTAESVTIHLLAPGKTADQATRHTIGSIAAGTSKTVEIELTARDAGELAIRARATAGGGIESATEKKLFCRKPGLEVDWRGPASKYAGAPATYYFRVRNPGTAPAEGVTFVVDLPAGFELQATSPGQRYDAQRRRLAWKLGALRPGDDQYLKVRGVANNAGANRFEIAAATADRLVGDTATAETDVIAVADLRLDVSDPTGPTPVGAEVVYEVRVTNRGSSAAEDVNVVGMFSEGIEPFGVEGARYSVSDGRVAVDTIDHLPAGAEKVVKIRARAERAGTHVFRAEVVCRDLEIKLSEEEMTRFYEDDAIDLDAPHRTASDADEFVYPR